MSGNIIEQVKVNVRYEVTTVNSAQEHAPEITALTFTQTLIIAIDALTVA